MVVILVRLEPVLIELEREQEDLLIIGHASVIRCLMAYLIGLPASEIPAIEVVRGDLLEVVPASYGVHSQAYHFWDGPGRKHAIDESALDTGDGASDAGGTDGGREWPGTGYGDGERNENNFYENYAEDTRAQRQAVIEGTQ